jgi:hypothetical protein
VSPRTSTAGLWLRNTGLVLAMHRVSRLAFAAVVRRETKTPILSLDGLFSGETRHFRQFEPNPLIQRG